MGYQLTYELQNIKTIKNPAKKRWYRYLLMIIVVVIGTIVLHFGSVTLETVFIGQGHTAKEAVEQMVENIREGTSLSEAVQAFCLELAQ